uniref:Uncharacterized protein n=1 Tax=Dunaliella tertiolecta TaxID=3047 RepID=A0A7S3VKX9_DUNTE|mmetsp:Transcript_5213/g.12293  ORF Transcript_5213/g.12293 Transcript_5213/m.12293 type:complete len:188 (+) Transcript_5213:215-778(+)
MDQQIDVLVNNAAVFIDGWAAEVYDLTLRTNFKGPIELTQSLAPHLAKNGGIVMTSSGFAHLDYLTPDYVERVTQAKSLEDLWQRCEAFDPGSAMGHPEVHKGKLSSFGTAVPAYKISKAMVNKAASLLSQDPLLTQRGISITAVDPGHCRTTMGGPDAARLPEEGADCLYQGIKDVLAQSYLPCSS